MVEGTWRSRRGTLLISSITIAAVWIVFSVTTAFAFPQKGEDCTKCHRLDQKDLNPLLSKIRLPGAKVLKVEMSPIKGLWEISVENRGQRFLVYLDFSKKFVTPGPILEVDTMTDRTRAKAEQLNRERRISLASIPLDEALVVGKPDARIKVPVFLDPD